jgi:hypothetical protein
MIFPDLDIKHLKSHILVTTRKEMAYEQREGDIFSADGLRTILRFLQMREAIWRRLQDKDLFMLGAIFMHELCATVTGHLKAGN